VSIGYGGRRGLLRTRGAHVKNKTVILQYRDGVKTVYHETPEEIWEHVVGAECEACENRNNHREPPKRHPLDDEADALRKRGAKAEEFEKLRLRGWRELSHRQGSGLCPDSCEICYGVWEQPAPALRQKKGARR
jgi:hypothetical protein